MPLVKTDSGNPLVLADPASQQPIAVPVVALSDPKYTGIVADARQMPAANLLTNITGGPWTVDYYSQVLATDSSLSGQRPSSLNINQQYKKIAGVVLRVTSALSLNQDPQTKQMVYTGEALVHSFIPNEGDMFVANIADGTPAIFIVQSTNKKAVYQATAYEISYQVTSESAEFLNDLEQKVVEQLAWNEDSVAYGRSPIIVKEYNDLLRQLPGLFRQVTRQYFDRFYSREFSTLLVPGQLPTTYDPLLTQFVSQLLNTQDCLEMVNMRVLNVSEDSVYKQNNIWSAIAEKSEMYLDGGFTRFGLADTGSFSRLPLLSGIRFSGIQLAIYPADPSERFQRLNEEIQKPLGSYDLTLSDDLDEALFFTQPPTGSVIASSPWKNHPVGLGGFYVLSQNFYTQSNAQSPLETQVRKHLRGQALDLKGLMDCLKTMNRWGLLEQFYYVPVILALLRTGQFSA